jgi:peptide/nickel transport system substrate-binding protein
MMVDCAADWKFLSAQSTIVKTFASNPLWQVVDGPWKLKSFSTNGAYDIVPNASYSGPQKPYLSEVDFVPYTSETAEYSDLKAGSTGANAIGVGYVPLEDAPVYNASNPDAGNPLQSDGYTIVQPNYLDEISYYQINFTNKDVGPLFSQPYFTTAIQDTVDQSGMLKAVQKGWGYNSLGAVPVQPAGNPLSPQTKNGTATFNVSAAKALLTAHGWNTSTSPATCTDPGTGATQCGAGITQGEKAAFTLDYPSGEQFLVTETESMSSDAAQAGIGITMTAQTQNAIGAESSPCAASTASGCWQGLLYGGWVYEPDYYPTGEALFATGAGANIWGFSDPKLDQLIYKTTTSNDIQDVYNYENYIATKQPVIYLPNSLAITAVANGLHIDIGDPYQGVEPEYWYYTN